VQCTVDAYKGEIVSEPAVNENEPPIIGEPPVKSVEVEVLPPDAGDSAGPKGAPPPRPPLAGKSPLNFKLAMILAVLADGIQIGLFPIFGPGFLSVADVVLDVMAFAIFWRLVGWHPALLPGFLFEQIPLVDLAPTWTIAVWIACRRNSRKSVPPEGNG
jgi:hypothetical protein